MTQTSADALHFEFHFNGMEKIHVHPKNLVSISGELTEEEASEMLTKNGIDPESKEGARLFRDALSVPVPEQDYRISGEALFDNILYDVVDAIHDTTGLKLQPKPRHLVSLTVCQKLLDTIATDTNLEFDGDNFSWQPPRFTDEHNPFVHGGIDPLEYLQIVPVEPRP